RSSPGSRWKGTPRSQETSTRTDRLALQPTMIEAGVPRSKQQRPNALGPRTMVRGPFFYPDGACRVPARLASGWDFGEWVDLLNPIQAAPAVKVARAGGFSTYESHTSHVLRCRTHIFHRTR